jgi:hypothetical protein
MGSLKDTLLENMMTEILLVTSILTLNLFASESC